MLAAVRKVAAHGHYIDPGIAERMAFAGTSTAAQLAISNKTVSTHKTRLLEKLNLTSMAELMRYAMQHDLLGYPGYRAH